LETHAAEIGEEIRLFLSGVYGGSEPSVSVKK